MDDGVSHHGGAAPPSPPAADSVPPPHHTLLHMTFFWGTHAEFLFPGWPGTSAAMYALSLAFVFVLAALAECISHCRMRLIKPGANVVASGFLQMALHALRSGLTYLVMLAVMSYNGGVFLAAVAGHAVGFGVFGSGVLFRRTGSGYEKPVQGLIS